MFFFLGAPEVASQLRRVGAPAAPAVEVLALPEVLAPVLGAGQGEGVRAEDLLPLPDGPGGPHAAGEVLPYAVLGVGGAAGVHHGRQGKNAADAGEKNPNFFLYLPWVKFQ